MFDGARGEAPDWEQDLQIFPGQTTAGEGRLYARLPGLSSADGWQLSGQVHGPECRFASTLPAGYPLRSLGPGAGLLAECFIPDPCGWSPALPHLYTATVELRQHGVTRGQTTRLVGIRPLGPRGRNLIWEGKRWVLRAVRNDEVAAFQEDHVATPPALDAWHAGPTALVAEHPGDALCREASAAGVLIVAWLGEQFETAHDGGVASRKRQRPEEPLTREIARLARWPAVGIAIVAVPPIATEPPATDLRGAAGNLLLAQFLPAVDAVRPAPWAQAVVVDVAQSDSASLSVALRSSPLPMIAYRPAGAQSDVPAGRAACDQLQQDLARSGDFAGYIV